MIVCGYLLELPLQILIALGVASFATIMKTCLFKYIENFTTKNCKFLGKISIFHISAQDIDYGYSLELPHLGDSDYPQYF